MNSQDNKKTAYIPGPLLSVGDAARYLGVGRKILLQLIERGEITAVKSENTTMVEKAGLDAFRKKGVLT